MKQAYKILHNETSQEVQQNCINGFSICFWANWPYWGQKWGIFIALDQLQGFFFFNSERGQQVHENYINGFSGKIFVFPKWVDII